MGESGLGHACEAYDCRSLPGGPDIPTTRPDKLGFNAFEAPLLEGLDPGGLSSPWLDQSSVRRCALRFACYARPLGSERETTPK